VVGPLRHTAAVDASPSGRDVRPNAGATAILSSSLTRCRRRGEAPFVPRSPAARRPSRPGGPGLAARTGCETTCFAPTRPYAKLLARSVRYMTPAAPAVLLWVGRPSRSEVPPSSGPPPRRSQAATAGRFEGLSVPENWPGARGFIPPPSGGTTGGKRSTGTRPPRPVPLILHPRVPPRSFVRSSLLLHTLRVALD
jgi:hypothetical protein